MRLRRERVVVTEPPVVVAETAEPGRMRTIASRARTAVVPRASDAKVRIAPRVQGARERVVPAAELAAERARQRLLEDLVPQVTAAVTAAAAASEPYRLEAQRRGKAAAAALRGAELEPEPVKATHRIRTMLLALGLGGAVAAAYKWMTGRDAEASWQQAYEPTPAQPQSSPVSAVPSDESGAMPSADPGDPLASADATATDPGAAGPDEALADATDVPHEPTWPDAPLEESDVPPPDGPRSY